jgi:hypothetical protein
VTQFTIYVPDVTCRCCLERNTGIQGNKSRPSRDRYTSRHPIISPRA